MQQYFGQDEALSGRTAGERLTTDGAKKVLCVIHEQGNISLEARCDGVRQGFKGTTETLNVNSKDMPSVEAAVTAKLQQDPAVDHIMALDVSIALTAVQSKANAGSDAVIDTFDTNAELVTAIKNGDVGWAIDQQPFLQGYLAIDALWLYLNNRNIIGGGTPVLTRARVSSTRATSTPSPSLPPGAPASWLHRIGFGASQDAWVAASG